MRVFVSNFKFCPRRSTDRTQACGACNAGSIPAEDAILRSDSRNYEWRSHDTEWYVAQPVDSMLMRQESNVTYTKFGVFLIQKTRQE